MHNLACHPFWEQWVVVLGQDSEWPIRAYIALCTTKSLITRLAADYGIKLPMDGWDSELDPSHEATFVAHALYSGLLYQGEKKQECTNSFENQGPFGDIV
jgi:hypothetical protein